MKIKKYAKICGALALVGCLSMNQIMTVKANNALQEESTEAGSMGTLRGRLSALGTNRAGKKIMQGETQVCNSGFVRVGVQLVDQFTGEYLYGDGEGRNDTAITVDIVLSNYFNLGHTYIGAFGAHEAIDVSAAYGVYTQNIYEYAH